MDGINFIALSSLLFSAEGRLNRKPFWLAGIGLAVLSGVITGIAFGVAYPAAGGVGQLLILWPSVVLAIKRCHDRGRSGWFLLAFLVPLVNFWVMIDLYCLRGTVGANRFGADPLQRLGSVATFA